MTKTEGSWLLFQLCYADGKMNNEAKKEIGIVSSPGTESAYRTNGLLTDARFRVWDCGISWR